MIPIKPKDVTWTDEQWEAIYEDNRNIIVSAGAGSGKTAVLTERVIRKLKDGVNVNIALQYTDSYSENIISFVNNVKITNCNNYRGFHPCFSIIL